MVHVTSLDEPAIFITPTGLPSPTGAGSKPDSQAPTPGGEVIFHAQTAKHFPHTDLPHNGPKKSMAGSNDGLRRQVCPSTVLFPLLLQGMVRVTPLDEPAIPVVPVGLPTPPSEGRKPAAQASTPSSGEVIHMQRLNHASLQQGQHLHQLPGANHTMIGLAFLVWVPCTCWRAKSQELRTERIRNIEQRLAVFGHALQLTVLIC